jgi:hypothetical protein
MPALVGPQPYYELTLPLLARDSLGVDEDPGVAHMPFRTNTDGVQFESTRGDMYGVMADLSMMLDASGFTMSLVPESKNLKDRDPRDTVFGPMRAAMMQLDQLIAIGLLYSVQGIAFALRADEPRWQTAFELAKMIAPNDVPVLEWYNELRKSVIASIPTHPFIATISDSLNDITLDTYHGEKRGVPLFVVDRANGLGGMDSVKGRDLLGAQAMIANAISCYTKIDRALQRGQAAWPGDWLLEMQAQMPDGYRPRGLEAGDVSLVRVIEWLAIRGKFTERWSEITRLLGWSTALPTPQMRVETTAADYVLSDGDVASDSLWPVLYGVRPLLSMGNPKVLGLDPRFETDLGLGRNASHDLGAEKGLSEPVMIDWSPLPVVRRLSPFNETAVVAAFMIPRGTTMGESDVEIRYLKVAQGQHAGRMTALARKLFSDLSPNGWLQPHVLPPAGAVTKRAADMLQEVTTWDAAVIGEHDSGDSIQSRLLDLYGEGAVAEDLDMLLYRSTGFNHRIPVKMAAARRYVMLNELGRVIDVRDFDGYVMYDGNVSLPTPIDATSQMLSVLRVEKPDYPTTVDEVVNPVE